MKRIITALLLVCLGIGTAFADEPAKEKDTFGSQGGLRYDENRGRDYGTRKEGGDITISYRWEFSTLLGEPILKCQAAWQPIAVWLQRRPNSPIEWIETKNLPPKVAASIKLIDLTVNASSRSQFSGATFNCNVGIPATAGKQYSYNLPTSPDWHEVLGHTSYLSKADNAKNNKELFKKMLTADPRWLATDFEYQVRKIQFDLSGVRTWLAEQEEKNLAKKAKGPKAKAGNLAEAALATMKEQNATASSEAVTATAQAKADLAEKERRYKEKLAGLEQKNVLAGTWKRDDGAEIQIGSIDSWGPDGGMAKVIVGPKSWRERSIQRDIKFRRVRAGSGGQFECEDLYLNWSNDGDRTYNIKETWNKCIIKIINLDAFEMLFPEANITSRKYNRIR